MKESGTGHQHPITGPDHARTQEQMRESEELFRILFETLPAATFLIDPITLRILDCNERAAEALGYTRDELRQMTVPQIDAQLTGDQIAQHSRDVMQGQPFLAETQHRTKAGELRDVLVAARAIRVRGRTLNYATALDITERKRAEEALRESENQFRALAENIPQLAWMANPDGWIFWYNQRWFDYTGTTLEQMQGWGWQAVHHPDHVEPVLKHWTAALQNGLPWEDTFPLRGKDGNYRWFLSRAFPIRDRRGRIGRWFGTNTDVTDLRATQEQLRERERQLAAELASMTTLHEVATRFARVGDFQTLLEDIVHAAISITHADKGNLQLYNPASKGLQIIAQHGFSEAWLEFFNRIDTYDDAACGAAIARGERVLVEDVTVSPIFVGTPALAVQLAEGVRAVQSTPILSRSGDLLGVLSTHFHAPHRPLDRELQYIDLLTRQAADFLEQHRAQQELAQAHAELRRHAQQLEQHVQQRTASLNESLRSLETLLYTIAHDLRAPNRAMQGYAQLLIDGYAGKLDEEGRFLLDRISKAALKNEHLIRDLLEFGRLAHVDFPCRAVDPEPAIAGVLTALQGEIQSTKASVHLAPRWPRVWANDSALGHVLTNLVSNALKYVAPGTRPNIRIYPDVLGDSGRVRICIQDNGIGVPPEQQQRIFEPFQRGSAAGYEGTGMGLAIVRKAAERMGGSAGVDSTPGQGSRFWIELLLADHDNPVTHAAAADHTLR